MKTILLILILIITGCKSNLPDWYVNEDFNRKINITNLDNDSEFTPYKQELESLLGRKLVTSIRFVTEDEILGHSNVNAICLTVQNVRVIIVNKTRWATLSDTARTILVMHEFGHCDFGLDHSTDPNNIMYKAVTNSQIRLFNLDAESALEEMFTNPTYVNSQKAHKSCNH